MAAGQSDEPKCLLPVRGEPFLLRLVRQLRDQHLEEITVVTGYRGEYVRGRVAECFGGVRFVQNERFAEDTNIQSLALALEDDLAPFHVIEADVFLEDEAVPELFASADAGRSVWYTRGLFTPQQVGGILKTGAAGDVVDLRIVPRYEPAYAGYKKLVGITKVGPVELERYRRLLLAARDRSLKQYYLAPWIENLAQLPCVERDLGSRRAASVNTPEEYHLLVKEL